MPSSPSTRRRRRTIAFDALLSLCWRRSPALNGTRHARMSCRFPRHQILQMLHEPKSRERDGRHDVVYDLIFRAARQRYGLVPGDQFCPQSGRPVPIWCEGRHGSLDEQCSMHVNTFDPRCSSFWRPKAGFQHASCRGKCSLLCRHGGLLLFQKQEGRFVDFPHVLAPSGTFLYEAMQEPLHGGRQYEITRGHRIGGWHQGNNRY